MDENKKIIGRLDAIIVLLLAGLKDSNSLPALSELFHKLKKLGFSNEEIASLSDRTPEQVAKTAYEFKRSKKEKKSNGK